VSPVDLGLQGKIAVVTGASAGIGLAIIWYPRALR
jgi:NADP-dependent 3-hydroxy acid dehydrogenase YdfG